MKIEKVYSLLGCSPSFPLRKRIRPATPWGTRPCSRGRTAWPPCKFSACPKCWPCNRCSQQRAVDRSQRNQQNSRRKWCSPCCRPQPLGPLSNQKDDTGQKYYNPNQIFFQFALTVASSEPVAIESPLGWNLTLFTSESWPSNAWTHCPVLMSQTKASLSQLWTKI